MSQQHRTSLIIVVALFAGWWVGSASAPEPKPLDDRPVMRWIAKAAKTLLWVAVFVEEPPAEHRDAEVRAVIGADGYVQVDHGRGW